MYREKFIQAVLEIARVAVKDNNKKFGGCLIEHTNTTLSNILTYIYIYIYENIYVFI